MAEMDPRNAPGMDAATGAYAAGSRTLQTFAAEMQRTAKDALEQTTQAMEKLRNAKSMEEVVSIQTAYLQRSFANYAETTRRFSELMITLPMEIARHGQAAFQQGTERMTQAAERTGDEIKRAGETMSHG